ncbi:hypothetical protein F5H01DRAFT_331992 [Linnemannia elongata]|nr:hypothetical protein F5H01DRAFT_331992 [Linnemannia elongata]
MITSDTNDNNNTNNNNTTTATNGRIPTTTTTTTTTPPPSATPRHKRRLPTTFKFRNLLSYIRLLILALAFVSLILDAIAISFQTNVMSLEYEDVAQQAYLLLTPDLLAIAMIAFLFIYPSSLFCGASSSGSRKNEREAAAGEVEYVEEYYDYGDDDDDEEEEEGRIKGGTGGEGVGGREGTAPTTSSTVITSTPETGARAGKATPRSQAQQPKGAISPSPSLSPATYNDNDDSLQQQGRYNSQNTGAPSRLQSPPTFTLHSHRNLAPTTTTNNSGRQQLLHNSQDHDRITTASTFDTAATTLSPPSISPSPAKGDDPTSKLTRTIKEKEQQQHTQEQPTAAAVTPARGQPPIGVSLAEMIAQEEKDETNRKRKRARLYTIARVTFSLSLTILALYWPAGQFKAPMGKQNTPPSMGEHQPIQGNNTLTYNYPSPLTPPPSRMTPTFTAVPSPTSIPTNTIVSRSGPTPAPQFNDGMEKNLTRASADNSTTGYYTGFRHKRGGHPKDSSWCAEEESFGDDESAAVYCRAKVIRPVVTYIWSVFLIVELCIAAMAGDFSKHGIRRRKQSFGDEGMEDYYRHPRENQQQEEVVVVGGDVEKLSGREADVSHGQSVQNVSISDGSAAGTGAGVHQPRHHRRPGSRPGY